MEADKHIVLNIMHFTVDAFWRALMIRFALRLYSCLLHGLLIVVKDPSMIFPVLGFVCTLCPFIWNCLYCLDTSRLLEERF